MKLASFVGALATALGAVACGGNGSLAVGRCVGDDPCPPPASAGGSTRDAASADDAGTGGPSPCIPGAACGGINECNDDCYTDRCCSLECSCTDPHGQTGQLACSLTCN